MTPLEAFHVLRERRIQEITQGRGARELSTPELAEVLRLYGCGIPRFEGDGHAATMAVYDWIETEEGKQEMARLMISPEPAAQHQASDGC
jgi:hypothetical protein